MKFKFKSNEYWWGGVIHDGTVMPVGENDCYSVNLAEYSAGNQSSPLFASNRGRIIWSEKPYNIEFLKGTVTADREAKLIESGGNTLRDACREARNKLLKFSKAQPEALFFSAPQYNTWAELTYGQNQQSVIEYAENIIANGYTPGVIMIDDTWQLDYGMWQFEKSRFPEPAEMVNKLHGMGFKVMLWIVPYISADSPAFREAENNYGRLLRYENGEPVIGKWWNGYSAVLDMNKYADAEWMKNQLDVLMHDYGIDGFKFDGGNLEDFLFLPENMRISVGNAWHRFGGDNYSYHEVKDTWKCGGMPYIQRLRDKFHCWDNEGLADLIPDALALSLTGHRYICPDMVGGGEWTCFTEGACFDEELVVRFAQCSALFPMIQFSVAPWRILNEENRKAVYNAQKLHSDLGEEIAELARICAESGEPMMQPLDYAYPNNGYETVTDEFLLGDSILAAPVLKKGVYEREVIIPPGIWQDEKGSRFNGPVKIIAEAPVSRLPWFRKIKSQA